MSRFQSLPVRRLTLPWSLLAAILSAGAITLLALWCQPIAIGNVLGILLRNPLLIILNGLPVGLLLLVCAFLFRNVFYGAALTNFLVGVLSVANRIKIEVRDEPVFPRDFALLKEAFSAAGEYSITYPVKFILLIFLLTAIFLFLGLLFKSAPFPLPRLRGWKGSLLGALGSLGLLALLVVTLYASDGLYNRLPTTNPYRLSVVFNETGFPYNFCHQFTTYLVDKPRNFNKSQAESWETGDQSGQGANVSVVMIMNEGFSDITDAPAFAYGAADDPLANLHTLQKSPHAVAGHLVVPGFAGGTANTEFDVLTGMQTNALSAAATSAMRVVNRDLDSLFRVFNRDGYHTSFFHPGYDWFYNRENVYRWLGAEETRFIDEMENPDYKGTWVTDDYMAGLIEDAFQASADQGLPLFHYTTTIQNHMAYTIDKYGEEYTFPAVQTTAPLSPDTETQLAVYVEGVRDADAMLGRLADYFAAREEPVVLVFWGDHLPHLGDSQLGYRELGIDVFSGAEGQENLTAYKTPYVIWANDAAAEALDWNSAVQTLDLPEDRVISAAYLGAVILELTGRQSESPWFSFLNEVRRELPVVQNQICVPMDASDGMTPTEEQARLLEKWRNWSYYKLVYKDVLT